MTKQTTTTAKMNIASIKPFGKVLLICVFFIFFSCVSNFETARNSGPDPLDTVIRETSDYLNGRLTKGIKLVFLNFQSECPALSEYIIDGLIENAVNDNVFTAVDRQNLALIQQEINFQFSGEVSDESAQEIGKILGAQVIISGIISPLGSAYRLRVRAISVETAEIQGQFNRDIVSSPRLLALISNCGATLSQTTYPAGNVTVPSQTGSTTQTGTAPSTQPPVSTAVLPYERFVVKRQLDIVNTGSFALSPDGKYVIVESNTGQKLCDAETGSVIRNLNLSRFTVAAFSPDGRRIITNYNGYNIRITDIETGAYRDCTGHTHPAMVHSLAYSSDGRYFVSSASYDNGRSGDNTVRIWDAESGQEVRTINGHNGGVGSALFSPNGQTIVSRDANTIYFWNISNGQLLRTISIPATVNYPKLMAYSPDGTKIAVAAGNRVIVFDAQNGRELFNFTGHTGNVVGMVFTPEGNRLISASQGQNNNLYVWNMSSGWGSEIKLSIGGSMCSSLALSSDGSTMIINTSARRTYVLGME